LLHNTSVDDYLYRLAPYHISKRCPKGTMVGIYWDVAKILHAHKIRKKPETSFVMCIYIYYIREKNQFPSTDAIIDNRSFLRIQSKLIYLWILSRFVRTRIDINICCCQWILKIFYFYHMSETCNILFE
jgi:hypothetical protein